MEHDLHSVVAFAILPIFAFANAGINFSGWNGTNISCSVSLGIALGLFAGNKSELCFCWLAVKLKMANCRILFPGCLCMGIAIIGVGLP